MKKYRQTAEYYIYSVGVIFDVGYEKNLQFSEDPLPVFHSLQKNIVQV